MREGRERQQQFGARGEQRAKVQVGLAKLGRHQRHQLRLGHIRAGAGKEGHAVSGGGQSAREVDHDALGAAVVPDGQPIPGEEGDVHGGCNLGIFLRRMTRPTLARPPRSG